MLAMELVKVFYIPLKNTLFSLENVFVLLKNEKCFQE
jgi:hypothetical protein